MKFISLFAGVGGFDLALERLGHECVYANEWDKYSAQTYEKNFRRHLQSKEIHPMELQPQTKFGGSTRQSVLYKSGKPNTTKLRNGKDKYNYAELGVDTRSITDVPASEIPDHELICGGFPCQSFSIAGKRKGFDDTRGTLFFDIARIVKEKRPRYLLLENVKGLLSHDQGRTYKVILSTLTELGYDIQAMVLNSKNFGVPQNRERVFIVGHIRGTPRPKIFPIRENSTTDIVLPTLTARYYGAQANGGYIRNKPKQVIGGSQGSRVYDPEGTSVTLASQAGGLGAKTGLYIVSNPHGFNKGGTKKFPNVRSSTAQNEFVSGIRRLTPIECERLQGFPDNWTQGVSDTQRYKQMGNAVTVNVVYEIAKRL